MNEEKIAEIDYEQYDPSNILVWDKYIGSFSAVLRFGGSAASGARRFGGVRPHPHPPCIFPHLPKIVGGCPMSP